MKNRNTRFTTILLALACFGLLPKAQAVSPAPDGGYANANTAEGTNALFSLTSGLENTANGFEALYHNTTGQYNTAIGGAVLFHNTTGGGNTATGAFALNQNNGHDNTATGLEALFKNTTGIYNTAIGSQALYFNTTGQYNTANGYRALFSNTTGSYNTATGLSALYHNTIGVNNTANGEGALITNTTGHDNTASGYQALAFNTTGYANTAAGYEALFSNTTGYNNTANGDGALLANTTGSGNTALGANAGSGITTAHDVICVGAVGANVSNSCYIGNIFNATSSGGTAVLVNSNGRLGTTTSSRRFKEEIKPMERASEALYALKPVTFRYKKGIDPQGIPQFGLVAEDVEAVNPDLVVRDGEGKVNTVRYDQVNAMLLNEFLKEHRKVEKLEAALDAVNKRLNEQEAKIQKVGAQVGVSKPATKVVLNSQ